MKAVCAPDDQMTFTQLSLEDVRSLRIARSTPHNQARASKGDSRMAREQVIDYHNLLAGPRKGAEELQDLLGLAVEVKEPRIGTSYLFMRESIEQIIPFVQDGDTIGLFVLWGG